MHLWLGVRPDVLYCEHCSRVMYKCKIFSLKTKLKNFDEIRFSRNMGEFVYEDVCLFTQDYAVATFHQ